MQLINDEAKGLIWFIGEIVQIIVFTIGAIMLLWLYAPFSFWWKAGLSFFSLIVTYDMFKHFVYVRYILWKESLKVSKESKWEKELKKV